MKLILGDNQFFGINHFDLEKGQAVKSKFEKTADIAAFIQDALALGMDGFMLNSNDQGYAIVAQEAFPADKEIHYSIPYPHKYASMVNEEGLMSLLNHVVKNTSMMSNIKGGLKLLTNRNLIHLTPLAVDLEVPKTLRKGSYVYLQNILTDLLLGLGRGDILMAFVEAVRKFGYKPGIITLNPLKLDALLSSYNGPLEDLIVCYNINERGFNVFPSKEEVAHFSSQKHAYRTMGMSVLSSGAANIPQSIEFIKTLALDYVVFGTSRLENVAANRKLFLAQ